MPAAMTIPVSEFKARCLGLLDQVASRRLRLIITKRGKPVARVEPADSDAVDVYGCLEGRVKIKGDLTEPLDVQWEALGKRRRSSSTRAR
jgi:prevent-host-death family protein